MAYLNHIEDFQQLTSQNSYANLLKQESLVSVMSRLTATGHEVDETGMHRPHTDEHQLLCQSSPEVSGGVSGGNRRRQLPSTSSQ